MTSIIIADDHTMFRESIRKILTLEVIGNVIAEASNGNELLALLDSYAPEIILMDISMPFMDGIEATHKALEKQPNLKILALSSFGDEKYYYSMLEAGAKGFVVKNAHISELVNAIVEISKGGNWYSAELIQKIVKNLHKTAIEIATTSLSEREIIVLKLICESYTNDEIAKKMFVSYDTVKWHRSNLLLKTKSTNTAGLVLYAIRQNLITL
jgi:DNA-binding NarL/FixJ family response regulator